MEKNEIEKIQHTQGRSFESLCESFSWQNEFNQLIPDTFTTELNIAHLAVDRHCEGPKRDRKALKFLSRQKVTTEMTFLDLKHKSNKLANALRSLSINKGDITFVLLNRTTELYLSAIAIWKQLAVFAPLFPAFGPEPILARLSLSKAKSLITTEDFYLRKILPIRDRLPDLKIILIVYKNDDSPRIANTFDFKNLMLQSSEKFSIAQTSPQDPAILHFTSGTTGKPKGAMHVHQAVVAHHATGRLVLDFHDDDVFWCTADPGWVTGTSYGIISPLTNGITTLVDESDFEAERWYEILQNEKVTVWYTAPTAIRMMMKIGLETRRKYKIQNLRFIASVGEPLNSEAVYWGQEAFGLPIHDNWWQTETGGIMIANFLGMDIKPGSMGRPLPGIEAKIIHRLPNDEIELVTSTDQEGELALKMGWPSMFKTYLNDEERYKKSFCQGYYLTGDLVKKDQDGYFWFLGRADDVIKSSGHLIGPFEVESTLMQHPAVIEAAVIGVPDPLAFEVVKAFVALKKNNLPSEELKLDILSFARKKLGASIAPKDIVILPSLPKTRSGKIMRRLLKARELGLPEGDTSTLETNL